MTYQAPYVLSYSVPCFARHRSFYIAFTLDVAFIFFHLVARA